MATLKAASITASLHTFGKAFLAIFLLVLGSCGTVQQPAFSFSETTIDEIHTAIENQTLSCEAIIDGFLERIERYDEVSGLNSIVYINPNALEKARLLDVKYSRTKSMEGLYCVPVILKDNFDTADMPTEAGSIALAGSIPPDDAFMVRKLRQADAIIIAKSNMGEWAFSPNHTISSTHGETRNAYDLSRVPAGSSGGTASAIAANFGVIGIGSDTGNSIRGPASHLALVGIRPTIGVTSRDGIVPLLLNRDVGGPLMRTVRDTARVFNVIAATDPADPATKAYENHLVEDYAAQLDQGALTGVRLGVLDRFMTPTPQTRKCWVSLVGH
jgi:amidase